VKVPKLSDIASEISEVTDVLRTVAERYEPESREQQMLAYAASALLFLQATGLLEDLDKYISGMSQPLLPGQEEVLRQMGLTDEHGEADPGS
jgi:hypothetical protein